MVRKEPGGGDRFGLGTRCSRTSRRHEIGEHKRHGHGLARAEAGSTEHAGRRPADTRQGNREEFPTARNKSRGDRMGCVRPYWRTYHSRRGQEDRGDAVVVTGQDRGRVAQARR
ncbi:hypothetical protein Sm713_71490 [Streptomyces sp. TS71-3]|nr:hypothetical protein Sm713_71490 [Streptomyces sp. TS71-3]